MISTNYISIKSVLSDLISTVGERYWNETVMLEWATKALRKIKIFGKLTDRVALLEVCAHQAQLPSDFKYLTQIAWKRTTTTTDPTVTLPSGSLASALTAYPSMGAWAPMKATTNSFFKSICLNESLFSCTNCSYEFSINENLTLLTTLHTGTVMVAYLGYPTNEEGDAMMPDNEELKEAILHYVLYRYWLAKYQMKEEGADKRIEFHLTMWSNLSAKAAGSLNMPDLNTLENIKNMRNHLVPRENAFSQLFTTLTNSENVNF